MNNAQKKTNISLKELIGSEISADKLLEKLNLTDPPFNPFEIASRLGITVDQESTMDNLSVSGLIKYEDGKVTIWVNPFDIEGRQRFTLAHELAHLIHDFSVDENDELMDTPITLYKDGDTPKTLYRDGKSNDIEKGANKFAADFLMPKEQFISRANEIIMKNGTPTESGNKTLPLRDLTPRLANIFKVTEPATLVRLKVLGMIEK